MTDHRITGASVSRRAVLAGGGAAAATLALNTSASAETIDRLHFLVGFGAGGGFDQTARGTMEALQKSGLMANVSVENRTGAGGSIAIAHLIETAPRQQNTLMVNGTSIVIRSLSREFNQTFRDVTLVNAITSEIYGVLVAANSPYTDLNQMTEALRGNARAVRLAGGSPRGGIDHMAAAKYAKEAGVQPRAIQYIAYDGGGRALAGLLGGEAQALFMPFTEALPQVRSGQVRLLALMSDKRSPDVPTVPTMGEKGLPKALMYNMRAFMAAPGMAPARVNAFADLMERLIATPAWEEVRARNAWNTFFLRGPALATFFETHEKELRELLTELGFIG